MDHVCDAIKSTIINSTYNEKCGWQGKNIYKSILTPLDQYVIEHYKPDARGIQIHILKAKELFDAAEKIADLMIDEYPFSIEDAEIYFKTLRTAWVEFIAYGSAHRMYDDLPTQKIKAMKAARKKRGRAAALTVDVLVSYMAEKGLEVLADAAAEELASRYKASSRTVHRRLAEARRLRKLPTK